MAQGQDELTVRIDSDVRASAEVFFRTYGFTMSTGINALLRDAVEHGRMPLEGGGGGDLYIPRTSTAEEVLQMKADLEAGRMQVTHLPRRTASTGKKMGITQLTCKNLFFRQVAMLNRHRFVANGKPVQLLLGSNYFTEAN